MPRISDRIAEASASGLKLSGNDPDGSRRELSMRREELGHRFLSGVALPEVADDTDDFAHVVADGHALAERIVLGEPSPDGRLVDDRDLRRLAVIAFREEAAALERRADGAEVIGCNAGDRDLRVDVGWWRRCTFHREIEDRSETAQRKHGAGADRRDAWKRAQAFLEQGHAVAYLQPYTRHPALLVETPSRDRSGSRAGPSSARRSCESAAPRRPAARRPATFPRRRVRPACGDRCCPRRCAKTMRHVCCQPRRSYCSLR